MPVHRAIPHDSLVLVTGANGYIASHICDILLKLQYRVRGTVRSEKPWLTRLFNDRYGSGRYEQALAHSLEDIETWNRIIEGVAGVAHVASDLSMNTNPEEVIPLTVQTTVNALEASSRQGSVMRVVLTSSSSAAFISQPNVTGIRVDEGTWNDQSVKNAWSHDTTIDDMGFQIYAASKTEGERAAWKWVEDNRPQFGFSSIVPNTNYGPILCPEIKGSTMAWLGTLLEGDDTLIRRFPPQWFVDVRDTARLHVVALLDPAVESERIFAFAQPFNWTDILEILQELRPQNTLLPTPPANEGRDLSEIVPAPRAEAMIRNFFGRPGWVGLKESLEAGIEGRW